MLTHEMVPKHEILKPNELKSVLKQYNITKEQCPKIKINDPIVEELGASIGDVLKITRISQTAGISMYYRIVIP
ncbi:MAG: DNA-directed RNA polymerase subunit H [Methanosarcinales archaeon]|jgi:DNA-directed RNA polymerase subunit H|nr:DNA-directed RNA polymerase subunit H [Methanosarcinales archaeon]